MSYVLHRRTTKTEIDQSVIDCVTYQVSRILRVIRKAQDAEVDIWMRGE